MALFKTNMDDLYGEDDVIPIPMLGTERTDSGRIRKNPSGLPQNQYLGSSTMRATSDTMGVTANVSIYAN